MLHLRRATVLHLAVLLACGGPSPETESASEPAPSYGGTAIVAIGSDFDVFNELATTSAIGDQVIGHVVFQNLIIYDENLDYAPALADSFRATRPLPPGSDPARLARGEFVWMKNAFPAALVLLAKSLPEGYAAPSFGQVLSFSGDLERHPYRRLLGVLQMVVNGSSPGGFAASGKAVTVVTGTLL